METTKTSVKIAKDLRKAGYDFHFIYWREDGAFTISVEGDHAHPDGGYWGYECKGKTLTAAYRAVWRQHKEDKSDG